MFQILLASVMLVAVVSSEGATVAERLKTLAGSGKNAKVVYARTKVGWEMGYFASPNNSCVLMGFDAAKGTEDTLISTVANYTRPLITSTGNRIVYTSTTDTTVRIMYWNGSGKRILATGMAGCLWVDAAQGKEYVICVKDCYMECRESIVAVNINDTNDVITMFNPMNNGTELFKKIHPHLLSISSDAKSMFLDKIGNANASDQIVVSLATALILPSMAANNAFWCSTPYDTSRRMVFFPNSTRDRISIQDRSAPVRHITLDFCPTDDVCPVGHLKMSGSNPQLAAYVVGGQNAGQVVVAKFNEAFTAITDTVTVSSLMQDGYPEVWTTPSVMIPDGPPTPILDTRNQSSAHAELLLAAATSRHAVSAILTLHKAATVRATLHSVNGRVMWRMNTRDLGTGRHQIGINVNTIPAGKYILSVHAGKQMISKSVVVSGLN